MEHVEIERRWRMQKLPEAALSCPFTEIEQGYLSVHPVVRVRRDGDQFYLTYKSGDGLVREEYNLPLTEAAYLHLLKKADGRIISKRRYRMPLPKAQGMRCEEGIERRAEDEGTHREKEGMSEACGKAERGLMAEIDVFSGSLSGLLIAEVEFPDEEEAARFLAPRWMGKEITGDARYSNASLSQLSEALLGPL